MSQSYRMKTQVPALGAVCPRKTPHQKEEVRGNSRLRSRDRSPRRPANCGHCLEALSAQAGKRGRGEKGAQSGQAARRVSTGQDVPRRCGNRQPKLGAAASGAGAGRIVRPNRRHLWQKHRVIKNEP